MEAERKKEKKERQVSAKNTPKNIADRRSAEAAKARENNTFLMAVYNLCLPGPRRHYQPKFRTDKYGNRIRNRMEG